MSPMSPTAAPREAGAEQLKVMPELKVTPELLQTLSETIAVLTAKGESLRDEIAAKEEQLQISISAGMTLETNEESDLRQLLEAVDQFAYMEGVYEKVSQLAAEFSEGNEEWSGTKISAAIAEVTTQKEQAERQLAAIKKAMADNAQLLRDSIDPEKIPMMQEVPDEAELRKNHADLSKQAQKMQLIASLLETFLKKLESLKEVSGSEHDDMTQYTYNAGLERDERSTAKKNAEGELQAARESLAANAAETQQAKQDLKQLQNALAATQQLKAQLQESSALFEGIIRTRELAQSRAAEIAGADSLLVGTESQITKIHREIMEEVSRICAEIFLELGQEKGANAARAAANEYADRVMSNTTLQQRALLALKETAEGLTADPATFQAASDTLPGINEFLKNLLVSARGAISGTQSVVPTEKSLQPLVERMLVAKPSTDLRQIIADRDAKISRLEEGLAQKDAELKAAGEREQSLVTENAEAHETNAQALAEASANLQAAQQRVQEIEVQITAENPLGAELAGVNAELAQAQAELKAAAEENATLLVSEKRFRKLVQRSDDQNRTLFEENQGLVLQLETLSREKAELERGATVPQTALDEYNRLQSELASANASLEAARTTQEIAETVIDARDRTIASLRAELDDVRRVDTDLRSANETQRDSIDGLNRLSQLILTQLQRLGSDEVNRFSDTTEVLAAAADVLQALAATKERKAEEAARRGGR